MGVALESQLLSQLGAKTQPAGEGSGRPGGRRQSARWSCLWSEKRDGHEPLNPSLKAPLQVCKIYKGIAGKNRELYIVTNKALA